MIIGIMSWPDCYVRSIGAGRRLSLQLIHPHNQWHLPLRVKLIIESDGSGDQSHCAKVIKHGYLDSNKQKKEQKPTCAELSWTHSALGASGSDKFMLCDCNAIDFFFFCFTFSRVKFYNSFFFSSVLQSIEQTYTDTLRLWGDDGRKQKKKLESNRIE